MGKATWRSIKENNRFYVSMYRRGIFALLISLALNVLLLIFSLLMALEEGMPEYYATDGIRLPILLKPLFAPNMTSTYLLPPDPINQDDGGKVIPE